MILKLSNSNDKTDLLSDLLRGVPPSISEYAASLQMQGEFLIDLVSSSSSLDARLKSTVG